MNNKKKSVLILTPGFPPNTGGLETHMGDLVNELSKKRISTYVLSYQPIVSEGLGLSYERHGSVEIRRLSWFGRGMFLKLVEYPLLEFVYLFFPLFFYSLKVLRQKKIKTIHSQGLVAAATGVLLSKIYDVKTIVSLHSIYHFPKSGMYRKFSKYILEKSDKVLTLSNQSRGEVLDLGVSTQKVGVFTYWVDRRVFKKSDKSRAKKKYGLKDKFITLFVGRLIEKKGVLEFLEAARKSKENISWVLVGDGPLAGVVQDSAYKNENIIYLGRLDNRQLPEVYSTADILVVPSTHEEGFGRVILEALSCGVPVIGANRGGIPEALTNEVGDLIEVTYTKIRSTVEKYYKNPKLLKRKSLAALSYAKIRFSNSNAQIIINEYE